MPCSQPGGPSDSDYFELENKFNNIQALLCEACRLIDRKKMSKDLRKWFDAHEKADKKRQAKIEEQKRLQNLADEAMSKLSTEEVEALRFTQKFR